ncbi:MAG: phage holin family protein [Oscillospiraceae bacterium]|jgi:uncharacterized membrane protein|nr:phage holin family protein [Oscillospiraceae bacterium]
MNEIIINLIGIALTAILGIVTKYVGKWIKANLTAAEQQRVQKIIDDLVAAAEQQLKMGSGEEKQEYVIDALKEQGIKVDVNAIEAAVLRMHSSGLNYSTAHNITDAPHDTSPTITQ